MKNDYSYYTMEELLQDDYFISSVNHPTPESSAFWNSLLQEGKIKVKDYELASFFIQYVQTSKKSLLPGETTDMWAKIEAGNKKRLQRKIHRLYIGCAVAACLVILISLSFFSQLDTTRNKAIASVQIENTAHPISNSNDIQIIFSDKKQIALQDTHTEVKYNDKGDVNVNSKTIEQGNSQSNDNAVTPYNQLIVPKGKHSTLTLSDGSKLWINASTRVVYPATFSEKQREIYIEGEVYLEVAHDTQRPFIVKTSNMAVKVLGTSFNVTAYKEETTQTVVLVSGAVNIKAKDEKEVLIEPNQLFSYSEAGNKIQTVNAQNYIAWKDGMYIFESEDLSVILNRLSRYYGKSIQYDTSIAKLKCSGKLDLKDDVKKVLTGLTQTAPICYQQQNDTYYVCSTNL